MGFFDIVKKVLTFDIKDYSGGSKVKTGTVPIGGVGATAIKAASRTAKILKPIVLGVAKKPLKAVATATGGLIVLGTLKKSKKARVAVIEKAKNLPGSAIALGEDIGGVIEGEKTFGKEDVIEGAKKVGVVGALAAGGALVIPKVIEKFKDRKDKDIIIDDSLGVPVSIPATPSLPEIPLEQPGELNQALLPETVDITKKKRKRYTKKADPSIHIINRNYLSVENYV